MVNAQRFFFFLSLRRRRNNPRAPLLAAPRTSAPRPAPASSFFSTTTTAHLNQLCRNRYQPTYTAPIYPDTHVRELSLRSVSCLDRRIRARTYSRYPTACMHASSRPMESPVRNARLRRCIHHHVVSPGRLWTLRTCRSSTRENATSINAMQRFHPFQAVLPLPRRPANAR